MSNAELAFNGSIARRAQSLENSEACLPMAEPYARAKCFSKYSLRILETQTPRRATRSDRAWWRRQRPCKRTQEASAIEDALPS